MSDYTPTTTQIRGAYVRSFFGSAAEHREEFDRWLASIITEQRPTAAEDDFGDASIRRAMSEWRESGKPLPENRSRIGRSQASE